MITGDLAAAEAGNMAEVVRTMLEKGLCLSSYLLRGTIPGHSTRCRPSFRL